MWLDIAGLLKTNLRVGAVAAIAAVLIGAQTPPVSQHSNTAAAERALLDQYCVTCHNDKTKVANFSLEKVDINNVADHPEVWEQVIRKLRAGMMPLPRIPQPPYSEV